MGYQLYINPHRCLRLPSPHACSSLDPRPPLSILPFLHRIRPSFRPHLHRDTTFSTMLDIAISLIKKPLLLTRPHLSLPLGEMINLNTNQQQTRMPKTPPIWKRSKRQAWRKFNSKKRLATWEEENTLRKKGKMKMELSMSKVYVNVQKS